jgi:hypothetical protein
MEKISPVHEYVLTFRRVIEQNHVPSQEALTADLSDETHNILLAWADYVEPKVKKLINKM